MMPRPRLPHRLRGHWHLGLVLFVLAWLLPGSAGLAVSQEDRLVTALYYSWYGESTWDDPVLSDVPAIPYNGFDPEAIAQHVGWANQAGIDVLVSAWFGNRVNNGTEANLRTLLDAAQPTRLRAAVMLETDAEEFFPSFEAQRDAMQYALDVHARHPAYFLYRGQPVIFVWRPRGIFVDGRPAGRDGPDTVDAWRRLREAVDPSHTSLWIAETEYGPYLEVFDGMFPYNIAWAADPNEPLAAYAGEARWHGARYPTGRLWIATAMPGYDDTRIPGRAGRFAVDRAGGDYYRQTFAAAVASNPDWINITSFNEWVEGHQIEPSVTYGDLYLRLTAELVGQWKQR